MQKLVSVRFRFNPKPLWFDPKGKDYKSGTEVLVETERGREVGFIYESQIEADDKQIAKLKSPLKPVIRELNDLDYEHLAALEERGRQAMPYFREKAKAYELDIKPVEVQYLFSGERAIFFFSSEERVDFRELVRDLAQHFHIRVDMRQIGARDEAKELGGLAHCGEEFCCTRFGGEFQPVSIRMAKEQDLPLNPSKISGACGRLMCCLRYEYEAYKDFKKRAPKKGTIVDTPLGEAVISGCNTPSETMELKLGDGKRINVPLAEVKCDKGKNGASRCSVDHETIERCATRSMLIALGSLEQQLKDTPALDTEGISVGTGGGQRRRRRRSPKGEPAASSALSGSAEKSREEKEGPSHGTRRRRKPGGAGGQGGQGGSTQKKPQSQRQLRQKRQGAPAAAAKADARDSARTSEEKPRPGQRSSGLRKPRNRGSASDQPGRQAGRQQQAGQSGGRNEADRGAGQPDRSARKKGSDRQGGQKAKRPDDQKAGQDAGRPGNQAAGQGTRRQPSPSGAPSAEGTRSDARRRRRRHEGNSSAADSPAGGSTSSGTGQGE